MIYNALAPPWTLYVETWIDRWTLCYACETTGNHSGKDVAHFDKKRRLALCQEIVGLFRDNQILKLRLLAHDHNFLRWNIPNEAMEIDKRLRISTGPQPRVKNVAVESRVRIFNQKPAARER